MPARSNIEVAFDLYTKRTKLYYITMLIAIGTLLFVLTAWATNLQGKSPLMPLYDVLLILGVIVSFCFIFIILPGVIKNYITDGQLILADEYLIIDGVRIALNEANKIKLMVGYWNIKKYGSITSNLITATDGQGNIHKRRFVIDSVNNNWDFNEVMNYWNAKNVVFDLSYHYLFF